MSAPKPVATLDPDKFVSFPDSPFRLYQPYPPAGDQPTAIAQLAEGVGDGLSYQTLLGVTGTTAWRSEALTVMAPGETITVGPYTLRFDGVTEVKGPNYVADQGRIALMDGG